MPSPRPASPPPARFTLLEVLVASALLLLLALLLTAVMSRITASWRRLTEAQARFAELLVLDRTLDHLLRNVIPFTWPDAERRPRPAFLGEPDRIRFAYRHELHTLEDGAIRFTGLVVEDGLLKACSRERPTLDWDTPQEDWRTSVLAREVADIRFLYADWDPAQSQTVWLESWDPERTQLPLAVFVRVTWTDGRQESWLRRTPGNGLYERLGPWRPDQRNWVDGVLAPAASGTPR